MSDTNTIEKEIELKAPVTKAWSALTDSKQFGEWFRVALDGPFIAGQPCSGNILHPGYEHLRMTVIVQKIEPERYFSYTWHPFAIDPNVDYSAEQPTLVEFRLEATATGTLLRVSESGFDQIPAHRRDQAFLSNSTGWAIQLTNIEAYLARA